MSAAEPTPRLIIFDGHGIIFRAYFAPREPLVVPKTGEVVTAVYGFASTLLRTFDELKPTHIAMAMDTAKPTFRHKEDAQYKAHRPPILRKTSRPRSTAAARSSRPSTSPSTRWTATRPTMSLPLSPTKPSSTAWKPGSSPSTATSSSSSALASTSSCSAPYQRDTVLYDSAAKVRDRYGIDPEQMVDFKGLKGDASDNISGVPGIGEKTAIQLLNQYATIEAIYEHLDDVTPPRAQKALRAHRDEALHSKRMATIVPRCGPSPSTSTPPAPSATTRPRCSPFSKSWSSAA